jgi:hypothetical protein
LVAILIGIHETATAQLEGYERDMKTAMVMTMTMRMRMRSEAEGFRPDVFIF